MPWAKEMSISRSHGVCPGWSPTSKTAQAVGGVQEKRSHSFQKGI